jgi:hypothetical protein
MKVINKFTVSTKKEKRTKKERNGCCYSSFSFTSFCPASGVHPTRNPHAAQTHANYISPIG